MDLQQRQTDERETLDASERRTTGELYVLKWDRLDGVLEALAGPFSADQIRALDPADLARQSGPDMQWATGVE